MPITFNSVRLVHIALLLCSVSCTHLRTQRINGKSVPDNAGLLAGKWELVGVGSSTAATNSPTVEFKPSDMGLGKFQMTVTAPDKQVPDFLGGGNDHGIAYLRHTEAKDGKAGKILLSIREVSASDDVSYIPLWVVSLSSRAVVAYMLNSGKVRELVASGQVVGTIDKRDSKQKQTDGTETETTSEVINLLEITEETRSVLANANCFEIENPLVFIRIN